jgi:hypothetical protein
MYLFGTLELLIALVGLVTSAPANLRNLDRAKKLLEENMLIDGFG